MGQLSIYDIISILFSLAAAVFAALTYIWNLRHDRKQATLNAYNVLQFTPKEISEIAKDPRSSGYKEISGYIARMEHFCVGVKERIYDRKTVYALAHGYLDGAQIKRRIEPIIEQKQSGAAEDYYSHITGCFSGWKVIQASRSEEKLIWAFRLKTVY